MQDIVQNDHNNMFNMGINDNNNDSPFLNDFNSDGNDNTLQRGMN